MRTTLCFTVLLINFSARSRVLAGPQGRKHHDEAVLKNAYQVTSKRGGITANQKEKKKTDGALLQARRGSRKN